MRILKRQVQTGMGLMTMRARVLRTGAKVINPINTLAGIGETRRDSVNGSSKWEQR